MKSLLNNALLKTALLLVSLILSSGSSKIAQASRNNPAFVVEQYGTAPDGSILQWFRFTPAGTGPFPVVILVHGGGFVSGGPPSTDVAAQDLQAAGFLALSITYRLAPPGLIPGQPRTFNGRTTGIAAGPNADPTIHDQMDDVRAAIVAARTIPQSNGIVLGVGGSAGGSHVVFACLTGTPGADKLDAAVGLSGAYQFDDFEDEYQTPAKPNAGLAFRADVTNYCNVPDTNPSNTPALQLASPASQSSIDPNPMFLIASQQDPMPPHQITDMVEVLRVAGKTVTIWPKTSDFQFVVIPGDLHEFAYWTQVIAPNTEVKDAVIAFLNAHKG
jgi:acetyl esterase/lipase